MPTNKLWIEHTERAAWESVTALRERLQQAESRLQALAPNPERVQPLLDALGEAKRKHAPDALTHDEVVLRLVSRVEQLQAELNVAKTLQRAVASAPAAPPRPSLDDEELAHRTPNRGDGAPDLLDFTRAMQLRDERQPLGGPARDLNRLLALAENKLDDLSELDGAALREAAVELALLASKIHAASRKR